jgi:hypothetical protein
MLAGIAIVMMLVDVDVDVGLCFEEDFPVRICDFAVVQIERSELWGACQVGQADAGNAWSDQM